MKQILFAPRFHPYYALAFQRKRTSLFRPVTLSMRRIWSRLPFSCALRGGTERRSDAGAFSCILMMPHLSLLRKILPDGFPFYDLRDVLFYFAFMLPPKPVNVNINFLTSLTLTDKINIYHSSFGEKMTVPPCDKADCVPLFWLPDFFDCSRIHPLSEFFLKLRSNTHFEKTPFDARRLRCLFLQHTACCLEFVFFLCPFVIADRKSQYRNTGQFASFSPFPQFYRRCPAVWVRVF